MRANWFEWRHATLDDREACRALIQQGSKSFYAASLLLPSDMRMPTYAVYAFCRIADDAVDDEGASRMATARLRQRLQSVYLGKPESNPCDRALADVVTMFDLPRALFEALIEGLEWDQAGRSYDTIEELHAYAARVASAVGTIMTCVMGRKSAQTLARACDLGVAMQLTNIARDVGEDARNGRVYLPSQWLCDAGLDPDSLIANPQMSPALASVVERLLGHADALYEQSLMGIADLPLGCRPAINAARRIYAAIGSEISENGYDTINHRAFVSTRRKIVIAIGATFEAFLSRAGRSATEMNETQFLVSAVVDHKIRANKPLDAAESPIEWVLTMIELLEQRDRERQYPIKSLN